jgi:hypothetical protein
MQIHDHSAGSITAQPSNIAKAGAASVVVVSAKMGQPPGIEVLDAVKRLGDPSVFKKVTLEDVAIAR